MRRIKRGVSAFLVAAVTLTAGASTVQADSGGGNGTPGSGGLSGGGGPPVGGGAAWDSDCGAGNVMVIFNSNLATGGWTPVPSGATLSPYVWPAYSKLDDKMVFIVDPKTGMAWGPPALRGFSGGEGFPPGVGFKGQTKIPPYFSNATFPNYYPWWACFKGGPLVPPSNPFSTSGSAPRSNGSTVTDGPKAIPVMQPVSASFANPCPLVGSAAGPAIKLPPPSTPPGWASYPASGANTVDSTWPQCPESQVIIGQNPTWRWLIFDQPVQQDQPGCTSGSGPYKWTWTPAAFTNRTGVCSNAPNDTTLFQHVLDNPPGVSVSATANWQDFCSGTYTNLAYGHTFTFPMSAADQSQSWVAPDGSTITATLNCDGPPFLQTYAATVPVPVQQIVSVPVG